MNAPSQKTWAYILGAVILCLLILLGWFAFHPGLPPQGQQTANIEPPKRAAHREAPELEPPDDSTNAEITTQADNATITNAADLYHQAFALYDALTNDVKDLTRNWRTNVDASVEAELCEKIRPICDLTHQASTVSNCDWGEKQLTFDNAIGRHLGPSRYLARTALWSAAHCRSNDVSGGTEDILSVLQLGQRVSQGAMIGCLVGMALQEMASSYVAQNVGLFGNADGQRLAAAFDDPAYEELPSRAMQEEADMVDRSAAKLAAMPTAEAEKQASELSSAIDGTSERTATPNPLTTLKQVADSERELANALASSSEDEYETWLQDSSELQESSPLAKMYLSGIDAFVDKVRRYEVDRALVVAGLAVAQGGTDTLPSKPDPSSGQPFVYTETPDGFELRSTYQYQMNGKPMTMQFKLTR